MSLIQLSKKANKINVRELALKVAQSNSGLIDSAIRSQLEVGQAGDGSSVGRYVSPYYARLKSRISKAPFGTVDLKLKGDLYKGIRTKITPTQFDTDSSVDYSKYQIKRYGKRIYEPQKENSEKIKVQNSKDTVKEYRKALGL